MNCKPGDLAVIVRSKFGHEGKIVRCLQRYDGPWLYEPRFEPGWRIDIALQKGGAFHPYIADFCLRPIRDQEGEDEILRIAGKPKAKERA